MHPRNPPSPVTGLQPMPNAMPAPFQKKASAIDVRLPPSRRTPSRAAYQSARGRRSIWSTPKAGLALVGRWLALAPSDERRLDALREAGSSLAALVREGKIAKSDAVDRCMDAALAYDLIGTYGACAVEKLVGDEFKDV